MKTLFAFLVLLTTVSTLQSATLVTDWTVKLERPLDAGTQARQFFVGSLATDAGGFIVSGLLPQVEKRSTRSGEIIWSAPLSQKSPSTWVENAGAIFGADGNGTLLKISLDSGKLLWSAASKGLFFSAPLVFENKVYAQNSYGSLEVYRADDGSWVWAQNDPLDVSLGIISHLGPQIFNRLVVTGFPSGVMSAYEPNSGKGIWKSNFTGALNESGNLNDVRSVCSSGDYLISSSFAGDLRLWKAIGESQKVLWEKKISLPQPASFEADGSRVYFSDRQGVVSAVETETGFLQWQYQLPSGLGTTMAVGNSYLWIATSGGHLVVLDKKGREVAKTKNLEAQFISQPIFVDDNAVILASTRGIIRRFHLLTDPS